MEKISVFTDGGARGNPGPAAIGVVIKKENGEVLTKLAKTIGHATNNVAEYQAVIEALKWLVAWFKTLPNASDLSQFFVNFFLDSRLAVNQINGLFKIKNAKIRDQIFEIHQLENQTKAKIFYQYIPREKNFLADELVNQCLDKFLM